MPACDAVAISHNHYDHLDLSTIENILKSFPKAHYFVPLGNKNWLRAVGIAENLIHELDWWQKRDLTLNDPGEGNSAGRDGETIFRFTCVPAQHNTGRAAADQGNTLWSGWAVEQLLKSGDSNSTSIDMERKGAIYHAGDTGYRRSARSDAVCPVFEELAEKLGPFDLSFLPIWRGGTLGFISSLGLRLSHQDIPSTFHASPVDAVAIHKSFKSRVSIGIHFGTFIGSENESYEAVIELDEAREEQGVGHVDDDSPGEHGRLGVIDIGGSIAVKIE